jgi:protocadherin Fat 1/2/3
MMIYKRAEVARGRSFGDHPLCGALAPIWQVLLVVALLSLGTGRVTGDGGPSASPSEAFHTFRFEHSVYNVSIPENSVGKTYAIQPPNEDRLGVQVVPDLDVKYRIIAGDKDKLFKAEERVVGDFAFLVIRTRTNNVVLNREKGDSYKLEVRATGTRAEGKRKIQMETDVTVRVKVLDTNDLSPLFYPTEYSVSMPEDTPLHKSIIKVVAEDADLGVNGEIYYSIADDQEQFAIHPTTGVITLTRPLKSTDRTVYDLNVIANDRGSVASNKISQTSRAKVQIRVKQVSDLINFKTQKLSQ